MYEAREFSELLNVRPCIRRRGTENSGTPRSAGVSAIPLAPFLSLFRFFRLIFLPLYQLCLPCRLCFLQHCVKYTLRPPCTY